MKITVLKGGVSSERDVSLSSGDKIVQALSSAGHEVYNLDTILPIEQLETNIEISKNHLDNGKKNLVNLLMSEKVQSSDFVFNALHGGMGENGILQGILQTLGISFNGAGTEGCAIAMDKVVSKLLFERYKIPTPKWAHYNRSGSLSIDQIVKEIQNEFPTPMVIKPSSEGSTYGLSIVENIMDIKEAVVKASGFESEILVEEYIKGRELTVGVVGDQILPVLEIIPKHGFYDYECKYTHGMSEYIVPAKIDSDLATEIQKYTKVGYEALKCFGYGRMDLLLGENRQLYFLEYNTLPGMTATSLVPKAAKSAGMSFEDLLEKIIRLGINKWQKI